MATIDAIDRPTRRTAGPAQLRGPRPERAPGARRSATVRRVVTGVSAQRELVERAVAAEAELVLVHHGLFWDFHPSG